MEDQPVPVPDLAQLAVIEMEKRAIEARELALVPDLVMPRPVRAAEKGANNPFFGQDLGRRRRSRSHFGRGPPMQVLFSNSTQLFTTKILAPISVTTLNANPRNDAF
jgi:hypothetical protein